MSDADELDDELLAVAGRPRQTSGKRRRQAAEDSDEDVMLSEELSSDDDEPRKRPAKRRASGGARRGAAAPTEESDDSEFDDGYDSDLMGDDEDRERLMEMNELDREMILAQRGEERDAAVERRRNAKMAKQAQRAATAAEAGDQMRSSTRVKRPDRAKKGALAELQAARRKKTQRSGKKGRRAADSDSEYSVSEGADEGGSPAPAAPPASAAAAAARADSDGGLSGEDSEDEHIRADQELSDDDLDLREADGQGRVLEDASYEEVLTIQVRRHRLETWVDKPFFDRVLRGCMVRVVVPPSPSSSSRTPMYVMAQIREVVTRDPGNYRDGLSGRPIKSPYEFGTSGQRTHRWLKIARGTSERTIAMSVVSNSASEEREFKQWIEQCEKDRVALPTVTDVDMILDQLKSAETYTYTNEDVTRMIEERRAKGAKGFNVAAERMRLSNLREYEAGRGNADAVAKLDVQLAHLESAAAKRRETSKGGAGMAGVNKRNTGQNFVNAFKNVAAAVEGSRAALAGADPFSRRQTQSRNYWTTRRNDAEQKGEKEAADRAAAELAALDTTGADDEGDAVVDDEEDGPAATVHQNTDTGAVELDIDISVLDRPRPPAIVTKLLGTNWRATLSKLAVPPDIATRKIVTLAEYKQRQGIA